MCSSDLMAAEAAMASLAASTDTPGQIGDGDTQRLMEAGRALLDDADASAEPRTVGDEDDDG